MQFQQQSPGVQTPDFASVLPSLNPRGRTANIHLLLPSPLRLLSVNTQSGGVHGMIMQSITDVASLPQQTQLALSPSTLSEEMKNCSAHSLDISTTSNVPLADVLTKIDHLRKQRNQALRRLQFTHCILEKGESHSYSSWYGSFIYWGRIPAFTSKWRLS